MTEAEDLYSSRIVNCVFNGFLSYTAIMLNTVTILALRKTSSLPKPLKTLLLSLAVSDLGVGLVVQPLYIANLVMQMEQNNENNETHNNIHMYKAFQATGNFLTLVSFFAVTALSIDRFLSIHLHLRYQELVTHKRVVAVVISIWVLSTFFLLLSLVWIPQNVIIIINATTEALCFVSTAWFYYKIYFAVRRHTNHIQSLQVQEITSSTETVPNFSRLRQSAVVTFYVYLVFVACYLPNTWVWVAIISSGGGRLEIHVRIYTRTLLYLNSSLNPLVYCWKMRHIRQAVTNTLRSIFPSRIEEWCRELLKAKQ